MKSKYFWSAEREVILPLQTNELDLSRQVKQYNAGYIDHLLDPFISMIH